MIISAEISLYALSKEYEKPVWDFLNNLHTNYQNSGIQIETTAMSTTITGEYSQIMQLLQAEVIQVFEHHNAVFVCKIANGCLSGN